jgi:hypothetical protein
MDPLNRKGAAFELILLHFSAKRIPPINRAGYIFLRVNSTISHYFSLFCVCKSQFFEKLNFKINVEQTPQRLSLASTANA